MADHSFTPEEVEALIPRLTEIMEGVMSAHRSAAGVQERQHAEQQRVAAAGGGFIDRAAWRADTERLERWTHAVQEGLGGIVEMGGAPKDLALGLVDFPHRRDGREVNLCWKYGEREIRFWHGMDEGFSGRKPL